MNRTVAQEVKIWEFSPYEVEVWYSFDSTVSLSQTARDSFLRQLGADLDRTFRAAWNSQFSELSPELVAAVSSDFDDFQLRDLARNELVLVTSQKHEQSRTLRSYNGAINALLEIPLASSTQKRLLSEAVRSGNLEDPTTAKLIDKCVVDDGGPAAIMEKLLSASIPAAMIRRSEIPEDATELRALVTLLPWQTESVLRRLDKLFFLNVSMKGDEFVFKVRELDCPMQFLGPAFEVSTRSWSHAARVVGKTVTRAFAPIARVEEAESTSAKLRLRAGGLIMTDRSPAALSIGDVLQPVVRRDDRNGIPTLLEPLSWTFAVVTASDGVNLESNVYTYSGGPGLQGRKNRRTRRVLLRVRPKFDETDIQVVVRGATSRPQPGCFVYSRDLLTRQFDLLGRTDWRGRFTVSVPKTLAGFLPDAIRKERLLVLKKENEKAAKEAAAAAAAAQAKQAEDEYEAEANASDFEVPQQIAETYDPANDPDVLPLNFALMQIYVKSGDTVLAKLPIVPGLKQIEVAELPDDGRRLQAEAFVRGFQGDILDLIGLRNLQAARAKLYIKNGELDSAAKVVGELRGLRTYNEMADELERIQREMLDEKSGAISLREKSRIDRMFQTTRNMLQKYLQNNLLSQTEQSLEQARQP